MINYLPHILRAIVTDSMFLVLLFTLSRPKYNKKIMILAVSGTILCELVISIYFYYIENFTALAKLETLFLFVICIAFKPLVRDSIMQWLFVFLTAMNVQAASTVLCYVISLSLPFQPYAHVVLRFLFFAFVIVLFGRYLNPLYKKVTEHWRVFFLVIFVFLLNFLYYLFKSEDIVRTMREQFAPLLLLIILGVFIYGSIFYSLKIFSNELSMRAENIKAKAQQDILQKELDLYEDFVNTSRQNRHDIRHHNAIILEHLASGDIDGAKTYLQQFDESIAQSAFKQYCKNSVVNAVLRVYERRTEKSGISFMVNADIPEQVVLTASELGTMLSNILENACEACEKSDFTERFITVSAETEEQILKIEVRNSVAEFVKFNNGMPVSSKEGGGTGTKSIAYIVNKYGGMLRFRQSENEFLTQIIISIQ